MKVRSALVFALITFTASFGQQPSRQEPVETLRVGTAAVQMDVLVTDKNGRRITGLTAADFEVQDEGKAQVVDYFTAIEDSRKKTEASGSGGLLPQQNTAASSPLTNA